MDVAQTAGIGAICLALIGLVWKIWHDNTELQKKILETVDKNTEAATKAVASQEKLSQNIVENTRVTEKQGETIQRHTEATLQLLTKLINLPKNGNGNGKKP